MKAGMHPKGLPQRGGPIGEDEWSKPEDDTHRRGASNGSEFQAVVTARESGEVNLNQIHRFLT